MKSGIHPEYYKDARVTCACGASFTTGSTIPEIHVEVCSKCHPFFTGTAKYVDTEGRVERFQRQAKEAEGNLEILRKRKEAKKVIPEAPRPTTLKEMMELLQKQK
jgi:large subunit ribosomal protein L31